MCRRNWEIFTLQRPCSGAIVCCHVTMAHILRALSQSTAPYGRALHFILLTLARRSEVASAVWADIDLIARTWTIPRTKNGSSHIVPLSERAVALLRQIGSGKPNEPVFAARNGNALAGAWDKATKDIQKASGTSGWHRHDLRRTGATMLGEMGKLPDIIEAALNHVSIRSPLAAT